MSSEQRTGRDIGDPTPAPTLAYGILGAILVFVMIVAIQALYYREVGREETRKSAAQAPEELTRVRAAQVEELNSYRWVDSRAGIVSIPIDRAIELTVRELNATPAARRPEEVAR